MFSTCVQNHSSDKFGTYFQTFLDILRLFLDFPRTFPEFLGYFPDFVRRKQNSVGRFQNTKGQKETTKPCQSLCFDTAQSSYFLRLPLEKPLVALPNR